MNSNSNPEKATSVPALTHGAPHWDPKDWPRGEESDPAEAEAGSWGLSDLERTRHSDAQAVSSTSYIRTSGHQTPESVLQKLLSRIQ